MAYWWERYTNQPDNNVSSPPDGAPENHFPDQVNNIQRQNMAAVAEIGQKVLGAGDGFPAPQAAVSIDGAFLKLIYEQTWEVGSIRAWDSQGGTVPFPVPDFPEFSAVTWVICDGVAGVPDYVNKSIIGAQLAAGPGQNFTGSDLPAGETSTQPLQNLNASIDPVRLNLEQIPPHAHPIDDPGHDHETDAQKSTAGALSPQGPAALTLAAATIDPSTTGITVENAGGEGPGFTQAAEHDHNLVVDDVAAHSHTTGTPPGTALELYIRTA